MPADSSNRSVTPAAIPSKMKLTHYSGEPRRIQLRRVKGWRMPANTAKVDRSTVFGNPFPVDIYGRAEAIKMFRRWLTGHMSAREMSQYSRSDRWAARHVPLITVRAWLIENLPRLKGKHLACWCPLVDEDGNRVPCHADVLLEFANCN
jgi:hypothetical protein